jgi:hypothetical protein
VIANVSDPSKWSEAMNGWTVRRRSLVQNSILAAILLMLTGLLRGCDGEDGSRGPTEIIVKLKEEGKRLRTVIANGDTMLFYGPDTLTMFDGLTDRQYLRIRQSYPRFSKRWQDEQAWRPGRNDSAAIEILDASICPGLPLDDRLAVLRLVHRWRGDHNVVLADSAGVHALIRLLQKESSDVSGDSAKAVGFTNAIQLGGEVMGQLDSLAVPAILNLLTVCAVADSDSVAVLRFARRLRRDGGVGGVADTAIAAVVELAKASPIGLRDSLAVASWVRLLAGDGAIGPPVSLAAIDLFLRIRVQSPVVNVSGLLNEVDDIPEVDYAVRAIPLAAAPPEAQPRRFRLFGLIASAFAQNGQGYQSNEDGAIYAEYAWGVAGGKGQHARVFVCDHSWWQGPDDDLPTGITNIDDRELPAAAALLEVQHGTKTLGVLAAIDDGVDVDGVEVRGTSPSATIFFSSVLFDEGVYGALDAVANRILEDIMDPKPNVVVIEAQLDKAGLNIKGCGCCAGEQPYPSLLPVEMNSPEFELIQWLVFEYNVAVVEAAGDGYGELSPVCLDGRSVWGPDDPSGDSGAILVGAGKPSGTALAAQSRRGDSNFGEPVDCQGWGDGVYSTTVVTDDTGMMRADFDNFTSTSAATAIVGALVTSFQSAYYAKYGEIYPVYPPKDLRELLKNDDFGTSQVGEEHIGPLPSLQKLMIHFGMSPSTS